MNGEIDMNDLEKQSDLFKNLKKEFENSGDDKESYFKCIKIAQKYSKKERKFLLYKLNRLNGELTGNDTIDTFVQFLKMIINKNKEYGFYISVIETSLEI